MPEVKLLGILGCRLLYSRFLALLGTPVLLCPLHAISTFVLNRSLQTSNDYPRSVRETNFITYRNPDIFVVHSIMFNMFFYVYYVLATASISLSQSQPLTYNNFAEMSVIELVTHQLVSFS